MEHVASVPTAASGRMSPEALALAVLLHGLAALALWWLAVYRPIMVPAEDPVEITLEQPKPPEPPPPPPKTPQPAPQPAPPIGLRPPADITADEPTQVRPSGEAPKDIAGPPPRSLEDEVAKQPPEPPPPAPTETALAPAPTPPAQTPPPVGPRPPLFAAPPLATVTPPPQVHSTPPPPTVTPPQQSRPTPPPPALTPQPQPHPSPLIAPRSQQPPAVARHQDAPTPPSSPFVNPADEHNRATAEQNYLWEVVRKLRGYRYHANVQMVEGMTVVQVVIGRDGRLLSAQVVRSSGMPAMDEGVLAGIRQGSPYTPLPPEIHGSSATFRLPLVSVPLDR